MGGRAGLLLMLLSPLVLASACEGRPRSETRGAEPSKHSGPALAVLDLSSGAPEAESGSLLAVAHRQQTFDQLVRRIGEIGGDRDVRGAFVVFGEVSMGLARAEELGEALEAVRQNGKPVYCHAEALTNATLYAAARACSKIYLAPAGEVEAIGLAAEIVYLHKLLAEQLHVSVDILQVGKFKGAEEPLTRDGPSDEARASLMGTLASMRESWVAGIRAARGDAASAAVEDGPYSPPRAKALKLVDEIGYEDDARDEARNAAGAVRDEIRFGRGAADTADDDVEEIVRTLAGGGTSAPIALVKATGSISMGGGEGAVLAGSEGISERALGRVLARLERDDAVRAVVLRIDSPGGSALASDLLWHRLMRLRVKKPLVVSIGEMAASGGYYLASAGQVIFAERGSIVGSMGVVGGKLAFGRALSQVGIHSQTFPANSQPTAGARAGYGSMFSEWDDATRARVLESMTAVYDLFLSRVAEGRHTSVDAIAPFAEGRIFSGSQGHEDGLVDEIGGLTAAIAKARDLAKLPQDAEVESVGGPRGVWGALAGAAASHFPSASLPPLAELPPGGFAGNSVVSAALGRLAPAVAPFATALLPLADGERALALVPFAFVVQ
jgi:protease-4